MQKNIQLRIDNPCSENWEHMRPEEKGRFCSSCKKTVVDFTAMTDHEMVQWFTNREENVCGRFHGDQLNRELLHQLKRKNAEWRVWRYLLAGLLISSEIRSQEKQPGIMGKMRAIPILKHAIVGKDLLPRREPLTAMNLPDTIDAAKILMDHTGKCIEPPGLLGVAGEVVVVERTSIRRKKPLTIIKDTLALIGVTKKTLKVYPNPVVRGTPITLALRLDEPGTYIAQLLSWSGMPIETMKIDGNKKSETVLMNIPNTLAAGIYMIRLSHASLKKDYTEQIIVL